MNLSTIPKFSLFPIWLLLLWLLSASTHGASESQNEVLITLEPHQKFQSISGWEVTARLWETNKKEDRFDNSVEQYSGKIFHRLVNELGINRIRIEIKSGTENPIDYWTLFQSGKIGYREYYSHYYHKINDNDDPRKLDPDGIHLSLLDYQVEKILLPIKRLVEANGERLIVNLCYVDFNKRDAKSWLSHARNPQEYAELISAAFDRLDQKYNITPDFFEVVLEPDNTADWRGKRIGQGLVAVAKRLKQAGYQPGFIAPSTSRAFMAAEYFDDLVAVPGAGDLIGTLAYHRYDSVPDFITLPRIHNRAREYGIATAMLESLGASAEQLHADLIQANVSAWQQYGIAKRIPQGVVLKQRYYYGLTVDNSGNERIVLSESGRHLRHYFRYIRSGALRLGAQSSSGTYSPVAFRNPDGTIVMVIRCEEAGDIAIAQLPAGRYGIRYTTVANSNEAGQETSLISGQILKTSIPDAGTITVYQQL